MEAIDVCHLSVEFHWIWPPLCRFSATNKGGPYPVGHGTDVRFDTKTDDFALNTPQNHKIFACGAIRSHEEISGSREQGGAISRRGAISSGIPLIAATGTAAGAILTGAFDPSDPAVCSNA